MNSTGTPLDRRRRRGLRAFAVLASLALGCSSLPTSSRPSDAATAVDTSVSADAAVSADVADASVAPGDVPPGADVPTTPVDVPPGTDVPVTSTDVPTPTDVHDAGADAGTVPFTGPRLVGGFVSSGVQNARLRGGFTWQGRLGTRLEGWLQ